MTNLPRETRLAILIDAENVNVRLVRQVLTRLESARVLTVKRAYGDWGRLQTAWKSTLIDCGIQAIQAPNYAPGKNSADMALTIDAMDLLHQQVNWFCLVSNDSDFTPLAYRLTGAGARVVGFGSRQASQAFVKACHRFVVLIDPAKPEALPQPAESPALTSSAAVPHATHPLAVDTACPTVSEISQSAPLSAPDQQANTKQTTEKQTSKQASTKQTTKQSNQKQAAQTQKASEKKLPAKLTQAKLGETLQLLFSSASPKNSWLNLSVLNTLIQKQYPGFSCKQLGYKGLIKLVEGAERFEIRQRQPTAEQPNKKVVEIRLKQKS
jgi:uncharacterized LabA/DUF88 family protein